MIKSIKGYLGYFTIAINTIIITILVAPFALLKKYSSHSEVKKYCLICLHKLGKIWITVNYWTIKLLNPIKWDISGMEQLQNLPQDKWYLLISNHQSWNDVFILQFLFKNYLPFQKYFIKEEMRNFPLMGFIWEAIDCPFLKRVDKEKIKNNPELSGMDLLEIREKSKKFKLVPSTIVSFVEGTRYSAEKHSRQQSPFKHLLKPKAGGIACTLAELNREIKAIIDVSLVFSVRDSNLWDLYTGKLNKVSVKINYIEIPSWLADKYKNNINYEEYKEQFQTWLNQIWLEKDEYINSHLT